MGKRHSPEQIIRKLRQAEGKLASGSTVPEVARDLGISEPTFHRWRKRYGGMSSQEAKRLKDRIPPSSLAKKAAAFLRISFSWRRILTSLRSLRNSSRSSVVSPSRSPSSISNYLTQLLKELSETPSSMAICATLLFGEERTRRTASRLNSGG